MKNIHNFEAFVNEKLTAKKPNDTETIDVDLAFEPQDEKDVMAILKKFSIKAEPNDSNGSMGYDLTGKKKDLLAYLQSEYYEMDDEDVKGVYPELLEGDELDEAMVQVAGKSKPSGAKVLAMVIVDKLEASGMLKPGANINAIKDAVQTIIMDSTF